MDRSAPTAVPIHPLLTARWSPRAFSDQPIPKEAIRRMLEAARWAPSSMNEQPWAFLIASKENPAEFEKLLSCLVEFNQGWAKSAPLLIAALARTTFRRNNKPNTHAAHDTASAMAALTFQATVDGLFVHQMAGFEPAKLREAYALPAEVEPITVSAIGYLGAVGSLPADLQARETAPRERRAIREFVFQGAFGTPASLDS